MSLIPFPGLRAIDASGLAMAGAKLQFYLTGTTTPTAVYTTSALSTPHANPVVADSGGLFAPIYLDPAVVYRCQLKTSDGALVQDLDPFAIDAVAATQGQVNAGSGSGFVTAATLWGASSGVITHILGYTPVNRAGDTATNLQLSHSSLADTSAGYLGMPVVSPDKTADYTFVLGDSGKLVRHNSGSAHAFTIPPHSSVAFPYGTVLPVRNIGAGVVTVTRGSGVALRLAGASGDGNKSLAQWGFATLVQEEQDVWVASGAGLS